MRRGSSPASPASTACWAAASSPAAWSCSPASPVSGKSTLLLQAAARRPDLGPVLYVSAEESARQVALRAQRLGCTSDHVLLLAEPGVELVVAAARRLKPALVIVDSVQTMFAERVPRSPAA